VGRDAGHDDADLLGAWNLEAVRPIILKPVRL
jgi:hypothetical protein